MNPDTPGPPNQAFLTGSGVACAVAVDGTYIYYADYMGNSIDRAELATPTNQDPDFIPLDSGLCGLAIHGGFIYWAEQGSGRIGRAKLDGTDVKRDFITGADQPCGVAVDDLAPSSPAAQPIPTPVAIAALSGLGFSNSRFRAAGKGASIGRRRPRAPVGTRISYTDSQPATTLFTVQKLTRGVKRSKRCLKRTKKRRTGKRCTLYPSKGSFSHVDKAGKNSFRFSGRVRRRKLRPGRYRLRAVPIHQGLKGKARTKRFRIVR